MKDTVVEYIGHIKELGKKYKKEIGLTGLAALLGVVPAQAGELHSAGLFPDQVNAIAVSNQSDKPVVGTADIKDREGVTLYTHDFDMPAYGKVAFCLEDVEDSAQLTVTTDNQTGQVDAFQLGGFSTNDRVLNINLTSGFRNSVLQHTAQGDGWNSDIYINNTENKEATYTISGLDDNGNIIEAQEFTLGANGSDMFDLADYFSVNVKKLEIDSNTRLVSAIEYEHDTHGWGNVVNSIAGSPIQYGNGFAKLAPGLQTVIRGESPSRDVSIRVEEGNRVFNLSRYSAKEIFPDEEGYLERADLYGVEGTQLDDTQLGFNDDQVTTFKKDTEPTISGLESIIYLRDGVTGTLDLRISDKDFLNFYKTAELRDGDGNLVSAVDVDEAGNFSIVIDEVLAGSTDYTLTVPTFNQYNDRFRENPFEFIINGNNYSPVINNGTTGGATGTTGTGNVTVPADPYIPKP